MSTPMAFKTYANVPKWARFLTFDEFQFFLELVRDELSTRHYFYEDNGDGQLDVADIEGNVSRCNIANLALKCGAAGKDGYLSEVRQYFEKNYGTTHPPGPFPNSFDEVRAHIRVRIYREDQLRGSPDTCVTRRLAGPLVSTLVYDLPNFVLAVPPKHLEKWNVSPEEALLEGIRNVGEAKIRHRPTTLGGAECFALLGEGGWAASQILHIDRYLPESNSLGAIVGLPNRHFLVCYPIDRATVFEAMQQLVPFVTNLHRNPPGGDDRQTLVTNLHWCYRGKIHCMPAGMDVAGLPGSVLAPPPEFIETVLIDAIPPSERPPASSLS